MTYKAKRTGIRFTDTSYSNDRNSYRYNRKWDLDDDQLGTSDWDDHLDPEDREYLMNKSRFGNRFK